MKTISFEDFKKVEIKIGKIVSAEKVDGSGKLLKLEVDFGSEKRQIIAGIGRVYQPENLIGKECPFVFNLASKKFESLGIESQGMILCPSNSGEPVLLHPDRPVPPGSEVK
jgi:methionine--tRNA ligase beta chain